MKYADVIQLLLSAFPALESKYEEEKEYIDGLPHLVFELIFVPYVKGMDGCDDRVSEAAGFIEHMLAAGDERVQEVAVVSVLEPLLPEREVLAKLRRFLGPRSRERLTVLEQDYGWRMGDENTDNI